MVDVLVLIITGVLLTVTTGAAIEYYRLIRRAQFEYEKARELVEDVVLSFNRELNRETDKLGTIAYRIEGNTSKVDVAIKRLDNVEKRLVPIDNQLSMISGDNQRVATALTETNVKMGNVEAAHETLKAKIADLQEQVQKFSAEPELRIEPVIPIRRDKAMAALTDTEISVLEMLSAEGAKTAPEIKERVKLSREHTARLMKKLYEEGYLERETDKSPFKYNVKKEMERLLKKPEKAQM